MVVSVSIIEDDVQIRDSIVQFLQMQNELLIDTGFGTVKDFLESGLPAPDVLLLDIELPGISGLEGAFIIKQKFPEINILMLTVYEDKELIFKALQAGATGYLLKSMPLGKIKTSILEATAGGVPMSPIVAKKVIAFFASKPHVNNNETSESLTNREVEVAQLLIRGDTYKQIAYQLFISPDTVRQHIKNIYRKLQINSRVQLINELNKRAAT
ncbi:LuxR family two component transcriptional regulator [Mucilaginibacter gracilis]|uniref:LuxR family two component transcriptional regulator n=1 Tax=Mucilaginibacter gracilis TaxID=423350 RepID=A0A495J1H8_9SPHI|nr:response regulator transcription factor [Mucilaginibacter gracilis]RKR82164.1 LuxR family two component transcriptional regulator [Mucilaginibacter gracilis]